jgi:hypothetical protein
VSTPPEQPAAAPKSSKWTRLAYGFAGVCLAAAALAKFAGFVGNVATSQVDEANIQVNLAQDAIGKANRHDEAGSKLTQAVFNIENMSKFPASRANYKADADQGIAEFESSAAGYREAAGLFEKAAGMNVRQPLSDYWTLQAKRCVKFAESQQHRIDGLKAALDDGLNDADELVAKVEQSAKLRQKSDEEAAELGKQADKVKQDHAEVFAD